MLLLIRVEPVRTFGIKGVKIASNDALSLLFSNNQQFRVEIVTH